MGSEGNNKTSAKKGTEPQALAASNGDQGMEDGEKDDKGDQAMDDALS